MLSPIPNLMPNPSLMPNPLLLSNPLLATDLLPTALLPNSLIGMAFLILALIVHLMHLPTIIRIVSLKGLILVGYIRQLKSKTKLGLKGGIDGVVIAIFKKGIEGG
jgi:hypothetical protein